VPDRNPFNIPPREISDAKVLLTLFGGWVVHEDTDAPGAR